MDKNNVKLGEIRLEENFYEAKIYEPLTFFESVLDNKEAVEKFVHEPESPASCNVSPVRKMYREG